MKKNNHKLRINISALTALAIGVTVAAAVALSSFMFASSFIGAVRRDAEISSEQSINQASLALDNYLYGMEDKLSAISKEIATSSSMAELNESINAVARIQKDIYSVMIYDNMGNLLTFSSDNLVLKDKIYKNLSFSEELLDEDFDIKISPPHIQTLFKDSYPWVMTIVKKEFQPVLNGEIYIAIDFEFSEIAKYIDNVGVGARGYCFVLDSAGNNIYHPQQQLLFSGLKKEDGQFISILTDGVHKEKNIVYTISSLSHNNWKIVGLSYIEDLIKEAKTNVILSILVSLICSSLIAVLIILLYSKKVNKPATELAKAMKEFENAADSFSYRPKHESVVELQILSNSFAHMAVRIKQLMEKVRNEEIALRKTELKALQAQINPHFLYNTLDSIQWMCEQGKTEDAVKMVGALAKLFRISISRGHELITIKDELTHAKSYLIIQSFRYKNQFSYELNIEEGLENYLCNKITVQPLIENAIYHGIDRMVDPGRIEVTVTSENENDILIKVMDNGVGMTEEQCEKILKKEKSDSGGIGVKNVNDRLKIYFGEKYGISIESVLDEGTTVSVLIPKVTKEKENEV